MTIWPHVSSRQGSRLSAVGPTEVGLCSQKDPLSGRMNAPEGTIRGRGPDFRNWMDKEPINHA